MGCDIHLWAEVHKDGKWVHVKSYDDMPDNYDFDSPEWKAYTAQDPTTRSYHLFGMLAGVRRDGPNYFGGRGWPDDHDVTTEQEAWSCDLHSKTWVTFEELEEAGESTPHMAWTFFKWVDTRLRALRDKYPVRVLIAFDN